MVEIVAVKRPDTGAPREQRPARPARRLRTHARGRSGGRDGDSAPATKVSLKELWPDIWELGASRGAGSCLAASCS